MTGSKLATILRALVRVRPRLAIALVVVCGLLVAIAAMMRSHRVPSGIFIGDVALGGFDWERARLATNDLVQRRRRSSLTFAGDVGICTTTLEDLGATMDREPTMRELGRIALRRQGLRGWLRSSEVLVPALVFDPARLSAWLDDCEDRAIANPPSEGRLVAKDGDFVIQPSRSGHRVDRAKMPLLLGEAVSRTDDAALVLPVVDQPELPTRGELERARTLAQELTAKAVVLHSEATESRLTMLRADLTKMLDWKLEANGDYTWHLSRVGFEQWLGNRRHRVERRARDATYEVEGQNRLVVVSEQKGSRIAIDQLFSAVEQGLRDGRRQLEIPFEPTELPKRTVADLEPLNIHESVGTFTTRHACCQPRVNNIHRIADLINGTIVGPGETFSLNERVGQRSLENGFVPAPSIEDGEMVDTIGGGVSQFATTFYNAVLHGGYEILERQAHTYWFDRYPMGHEATLSWPKPDVVIRNDTQSGLLILASYTEKTVTLRLFGDREGRRVDVSVSPRFDVVRPAIEYLPNSELDPEKERVKEGGCIGWSVWTMRTVTMKDGTTKKDKRKVVYKPRVRRVEVHPCRIPSGEPGHTGETCPKPALDPNTEASTQNDSGSNE